MADTSEESSSDCSDAYSSDNFSIYTESSSSDEDLQNEEPAASSSSAKKRKSRSEKSNSSTKPKQSARKTAKKTKQASNALNEGQLEELTSWIFSTQKAVEIEGIIRSMLLESPRLKSNKERERFTFALFITKSKLSTVDSWILPQVFDACKRMRLVSRQGEQKSCLLCGLDENVGKFSSRKANSRKIDSRTFLSGTIGTTSLSGSDACSC